MCAIGKLYARKSFAHGLDSPEISFNASQLGRPTPLLRGSPRTGQPARTSLDLALSPVQLGNRRAVVARADRSR